MKPAKPRPVWCVVDYYGHVLDFGATRKSAGRRVKWDDDRRIRYVPAPSRRKRRKSNRA